MRKLSAVLIDLSGTLHIEDYVIPGAIDALNKLRTQSELKIKFVTNTTKESKRVLYERLQRIGFSIGKEDIFTSLTAARAYIEKLDKRPFLMLADEALEDFEGISCEDPNAVVVGLAPSAFHYENMTSAFRLLLGGASLLAIHKARYYKRSDGLALGPGAFVAGLEYASGVQADVVGKPESSFFLSALDSMGCVPEESIMIGDDAKDDIAGAINAGLLGILVRTGKYRANDENTIDPPPLYTADAFPEAINFILDNFKIC